MTQCDSLTHVRNGHISNQSATLLAVQVKLTHGLGSSSGAERTKSLLVKHYLVHMRFLISGFSQVWIRSESFHQNLRSTFTKPLLIVRFFLRLKEVKKNYAKTTSLAPYWSSPSMRRASGFLIFLGVDIRDE